MASRSLHSTTRKPLSWQGKVQVMYDAPTRADREAAIKSGSLVETSLEHAIKAKLVRLKKSEYKALFEGPSAPLSTFSAKIWIGYALGIYGPKAKHDLETIKDIRNVFAHATQHITFKNRQIVARCKGMHFVQRRLAPGAKWRTPARTTFLEATRVYAFLLTLFVWNVTRLKAPSAGDGGDLSD